MMQNNPVLCTKCFIFPCVCGEQYKTLTHKQRHILITKLQALDTYANVSYSLKDMLTADMIAELPKHLANFLFVKNTGKRLSDVWVELKNNNLLWKSCLHIFLSKYCNKNTTKNYYDLVTAILEQYNLPHYNLLAQMMLPANTGSNINIALLRSCLESDVVYNSNIDVSLLKPYVGIAMHNTNNKAMSLLKHLSKIICQIGDVDYTDDVMNSTSFEIEDKIVFIDEAISNIVIDNLSGEFDNLTID